MVVTDERKQRKGWAKRVQAKLNGHRRHRYPPSPPPQPTGAQSYTADAQAADVEDLAERRGTAQPSVVETAQERRNNHVERWIYPWAYAVCLRAKSIRESRWFDDHVDLLTARAECGPYMEDEIARLAMIADEIFSEPPTDNAFTIVRERMEALNARESFTDKHSDEYVAVELRLFMLTGAWGLDLCGTDLYALVQEIEGDLNAFDDALRKPVRLYL